MCIRGGNTLPFFNESSSIRATMHCLLRYKTHPTRYYIKPVCMYKNLKLLNLNALSVSLCSIIGVIQISKGLAASRVWSFTGAVHSLFASGDHHSGMSYRAVYIQTHFPQLPPSSTTFPSAVGYIYYFPASNLRTWNRFNYSMVHLFQWDSVCITQCKSIQSTKWNT